MWPADVTADINWQPLIMKQKMRMHERSEWQDGVSDGPEARACGRVVSRRNFSESFILQRQLWAVWIPIQPFLSVVTFNSFEFPNTACPFFFFYTWKELFLLALMVEYIILFALVSVLTSYQPCLDVVLASNSSGAAWWIDFELTKNDPSLSVAFVF